MVPAGFIFDGASIPIGLRWLFPFGGPKMFGACLHDYLYRHSIGIRKEADGIFLDAMIANKVSVEKAKWMYWGVRLFGWIAWLKNKRR